MTVDVLRAVSRRRANRKVRRLLREANVIARAERRRKRLRQPPDPYALAYWRWAVVRAMLHADGVPFGKAYHG